MKVSLLQTGLLRIFRIPWHWLLLSLLVAITPSSRFGQTPAGKGDSLQRRSGYLGRITQRGVLVVGLQRDYHPFHMEHPVSDAYPGLDVELAGHLARSLGVRLRLEFLPLDQLLRGVAEERLDLSLGGISGNLERARGVDFSVPYLKTTPAALLSRRELPPESGSVDYPRRKFESLSDLRYAGRLKLGVLSGTTNQTLLNTDPEFRKHTVVAFDNRDALIEALNRGEVDALVADGVYIRALIHKHSEYLNRFVPLLKTYRVENISAAIPPGHAGYLYYVNFFIREMERTGVMDDLRKRYLESDDWVPR